MNTPHIFPSQDAITTGNQFTSHFAETNGPNPGLAGTATFTIGAPSSSGFFNISDFSVTTDTGVCLSCALSNEDHSHVLFDAVTFDIKGNITGTFQESGSLHTFNLALTDPAGTWSVTDIRALDGHTEVSLGTYTPLSAQYQSLRFGSCSVLVS